MHIREFALSQIRSAADSQLSQQAAEQLLNNLVQKYGEGISAPANWVSAQLYPIIEDYVLGLSEEAHLQIAFIALDCAINERHRPFALSRRHRGSWSS